MSVLITLHDVEPAVRLNALLEKADVQTTLVSPLDDIRAMLRRARPVVVVVTGEPRDPQNLALVRELLWDGIAVVALADMMDAALVERLEEAGYVEVYEKPVPDAELFATVRRLLDRQRLSAATGLVGWSDAVSQVLVQVEQIAPVSSTVLVEGESGTGKELVARAIHRLSPRRGKPFIAVNVGALADTLLESELFGHEKGAFTGAAERRLGRFELADTGTLFLDEIGEVPHATQVKLLRVLEEREVTRVGGTQTIPVNVRVIAATNRPLREAVEAGTFRADLFYRLNVLTIYLPPLRERKADIPLLVRQFVRQLSAEHDREFRGISPEAMQLLMDYPWPGNVRELRNLVESMVVLAPGREIGPEDIPHAIRQGGAARLLPVHVGPAARAGEGLGGRELEFILRSLVELKLQVEELRRRMDEERSAREQWVGDLRPGQGYAGLPPTAWGIEPPDQPPPPNVVTIVPGTTMAEIERLAIEAALKETRGNRRRAADLLGIGERTLYRKLREYALEPEDGSLD